MKTYSVFFLKKYINLLFKERLKIKPIFIVPGEKFPDKIKNFQHVILVGHVIELYYTLNLKYECKTIYIWVLSSTHKNLLVSYFKINPQEIGVIPRYKIIKTKKNRKTRLNFSRRFTLVMANRWRIVKNYKDTITLFSMIQNEFIESCYIVFCFSSKIEGELCKEFLQSNYPTLIYKIIIRKKNWALHVENKFSQPILFNLSSDISEDFGVSVAEVEKFDWPLVLSHWGSHLDIFKSKKIYFELNKESSFKNVLNNFKKLNFEKKSPFKITILKKCDAHILRSKDVSLQPNTLLYLKLSRYRLDFNIDKKILEIMSHNRTK